MDSSRLRKETTFDAIDLSWYSNGKSYDILISNDGTNWKTIKSITDAKYGQYARFDFNESITARYVKIQGVSEAQYSLFAFRVLQKTGSEDEVELEPWNLALNKPAYSSGLHPSDGNGKAEKYAVDGSVATRWASRTNDEWFYVDLQADCNIQAVNILWETASAKEFKLQISTDGKTWNDIAYIKNNSVQGDWTNHTFTQDYIGRYVRMQGIEANTKYGYSIYEFQVMGTTIGDPDNQDINSISFVDNAMSMLKGQTTTLDFITDPENISSSSIGWKSSNPSLVTVNNNGKITVKGETGFATITAYSIKNPDVKAECTITITPSAGKIIKVEELSLINTIDTLALGDIHQLSAKITPENATHKYIIWSSSDETIIQVDATGKLQAVGIGVATITAKTTAQTSVDLTITVQEVNKDALQEVYDNHKDKTSETYTPASWQVFNDAMQQARAILDNPNAIQKEVDQALTTLITAVEGLTKKANKFELKIALDLANAITDEDLENVVPVVVNEFKQARDKANEVYNNATASQDNVDAAFDRLASVMQKLEFFKGDKTALKAFIDKVSDLEAAKYTEATWTPFNDALKVATSVYEDENAMQEEVNNAYNELVTAFLKLRIIPDKSLLEDLINKANGLNSANYTKATFDGLTKALNEAKVVFDNPNATQVEVDNAKDVLTKAIANLQTVNNGDTTVSVKTGDESLVGMFAGITLLSVAGYALLRRKED